MENGSLGPPLRFKAVNTETGESSEHLNAIFRIVSTNHILHLQVADYNCDKFTFRFNNPSFNSRPKAKVEICQSTGLHDSRGVEIFAGDCATYKRPKSPISTVCYDVFKGFYLDPYEHTLDKHTINHVTIIGNRWQSREVLEQKAREVKS